MKKRAVHAEGKPIGIVSNNVSFDSQTCEIEFADGQTEISTAGIVAENLLVEVDAEGNSLLFMDEIEDHRKTSDAIPKDQGTFETARGIKQKKRTARGWNSLSSGEAEALIG